MIKQQCTSYEEPSASENNIIFGDVEVNEENVIKFIYGLPGFETLTRFTVDELKDYPPFRVLQSLEEPDISMLILDIRLLKIRDQIKIPFKELKNIGIDPGKSIDDTEIYVILKVDNERQQLTANIKAPIVINNKDKVGCQVILEDKNLSIEYSVKEGLS